MVGEPKREALLEVLSRFKGESFFDFGFVHPDGVVDRGGIKPEIAMDLHRAAGLAGRAGRVSEVVQPAI